MKKFVLIFLISNLLLGQNFFNKGINLTNWFQANSPREINFKKYTKADFQNIKSLGCDVIRLPIFLHTMADSTEGYSIDTLFLSFLDSAVDWAEELNINIILDNHTFNPFVNTPADIKYVLIPVWRNMAEHFKNRSSRVFYEILNEPHGISNDNWNAIQQETINAIREIDSVHTIIVGAADWTGYNGLKYLPSYSDTNLIYTFHFYDPMLFTHQGANWVTPSLVSLNNIPFPFNQSTMPELPSEFSGTWIEDAYNNYNVEGTEEKIRNLIKIATDFRDSRNVKIFCGEFGVLKHNSRNEDRIKWYELVRKIFDQENIPWTSWDYQGGFGLFEKNSYELFDYNLNIQLLEALGLNIPPQYEFRNEVEEGPFTVYDDYIGNMIDNNSWISSGSQLDFYSSDNPKEGNYSIFWSNAELYNFIGFNFSPNKNFNYIINNENSLYLSLWIKGDTPNTSIDFRFLDTKTDDAEDHPWRMRYTLSDTNGYFNWDNTWRQIIIPFSEFEEQGSWDNEQWYEPKGEFDWSAVDLFQIVAEHHNLTDRKIWIDDIVIKSTNVSVRENYENIEFNLEQNYPNPFNPSTVIKFSLPSSENVKLEVFNLLGEKIATLINEPMSAGNHKYEFNASKLNSGLYLYKISAGSFVGVKKMMLVK